MERATVLDWSPRLLLIAYTAFLGLFALDVFGLGLGFWRTLGALLMHLLPNVLLLMLLVLAWRRPWLGGLVCLGLAAAYAATAGRRFGWTAVALISGPLLLTGALYLLSWAARPRPHAG